MGVDWLIPWHPVEDASERRTLLAELQRELPSAHILSGVQTIPIARRHDCDDVLFALADDRVAVVHLTWSGRTEPLPELPWTVVFDSLNRFVDDNMKPEHEQWR